MRVKLTVTAIPVTGYHTLHLRLIYPTHHFQSVVKFNLISRINYGIEATITVEQNGFKTIKKCKVSPDTKGNGILDIAPDLNGSMSKIDRRTGFDYLDKNVFAKSMFHY